MSPPLSPAAGLLLLASYGTAMLLLVAAATRAERSADEHLVANRTVGLFAGAFSIAVTWVWAPAVFLASQKAYEDGVAGLFWFTLPNILTFATFAPVALRLRRLLPAGYSLPDYAAARFGDPLVHLAFVVPTLAYGLGAVVINTLAGGLLLHALCGLPVRTVSVALAVVALAYSVWRGLPASIVTDVVQMSLLLFVALLLVPAAVIRSGGFPTLASGLGGLAGTVSPLGPVAWSFGIPATLGLISGPIADQMFWQRALAAKTSRVVGTFLLGGALFGTVPVLLSVLGFLGAAPSLRGAVAAADPQMVSVAVVDHLLPAWTLGGFAVLALCALSSTLDSAYCAIGSLGAVDLYRRYLNPAADDRGLLRASRWSMVIAASAGTSLALLPGLRLVWVFLIYGALASAALGPTLLLLWKPQVGGRPLAAGILVSFAVGLPLSVAGNATGSTPLVLGAALLTPALGFAVPVLFRAAR